jgi:hypothetical protein
MNEEKIIKVTVPIGDAINQITALTAEIAKLSAGQAALAKGTEGERKQFEANKVVIKEYTNQKRQLTNEVQKEVRASQDALGAYQKLQNQYTVAAQKAKNLAAENTATSKEIKKAATEANKLNDKLKEIDGTVGQHTRKVGNYKDALSGLGRQFLSMVGLTAIVAGLGRALSNALNVITQFDEQMAKVSAITMATKEEMKQLRDIAVQYGTTTKFTATEVAGLEVELGKLGYTTQQIIDATGGVVMAAAATGESLQKTAEIVGSVTMAFGLSAGESQRVADVMAQSFNATALGLDNFSESIKYVAPIAKQVGVSVEETAALLGALANSGIKGSMAGTALRRIFTELTKDGGTLQERLDQLAKSGLNLAGAQDEVGAYAKTALLVLKDQHELIPQLTKEFENSAGAAEIAANKMMDTIKGQSTILKSTWDGFILSVENGTGRFATNLKYMLQQTAEFVRGMQRFLGSDADNAKINAQNSAQSRLRDFEKRAQSQQDYTKYLNEEIVAEKGVYSAKLAKATQLENENKQTKEWIVATENYLKTNRDINFERVKNLTAAKFEFENKEKEINGLKNSVNNSIEYVNVLGNLRRAKSDQTALEIKNQETLDLNNALTGDAVDLTKEQQKELDKLNKTKEQEYNLNLKLKKQIEEMNQDIKKMVSKMVSTPISQQSSFNYGLDEKLKAVDENRKLFLENEANRLQDELFINQNNFDIKNSLLHEQLNLQMNDELSAKQLTEEQKKAIEDKYRLLNNEADKETNLGKIGKVVEYAAMTENVLGNLNGFIGALGDAELQRWASVNKGKAGFDEEYAKKKAKLEHDAAVRNKALAAMSTIVSTAQSIMAALAIPLGAGVPLAIANGIAGAVQLATILATPIPDENSTSVGGGGAKASLPPDLTSKMASPLSGSVNSVSSYGGANAITSGAAQSTSSNTMQQAIFQPKVELSLVELERSQNKVKFIDNISTFKG